MKLMKIMITVVIGLLIDNYNKKSYQYNRKLIITFKEKERKLTLMTFHQNNNNNYILAKPNNSYLNKINNKMMNKK